MNSIGRVRAALRKSGQKAMNPDGLASRIAKKASMTEAEAVLVLQELKNKGEVTCSAWNPNGRPAAKLYLHLPPAPLEPYEQMWDKVLLASFDDCAIDAITSLRGCATAVKNMTEKEMLTLVNGLLTLRQEMQDDPSRFLGKRKFDISAQYLLGSSKLLKSLPAKNMQNFGLPVDQLLGSPRYVLVAGAARAEATILVENPHSFESAVMADKESRFCWIATYGYGLSKSDESFGEQFVDVVSKSSSVITLSRRAYNVEFKHAIDEARESLFFWGDLDLSGLDIYGRLKKLLPSLRLSRLYQPMIEELQRGGGHTYQCVRKDKQNLGEFDFDEIRLLSKLCLSSGIDQEFVDMEKHLNLSILGINDEMLSLQR